MRASTWAPVPEGVFERRLLRPTAQPAESGEGGETSTSKLAVPLVFHSPDPPRTVCATEGLANLLVPQPVSQSGPDAWISEIRDYLKENILLEDHVTAERIVRSGKRYTVVEGDLYRRGANDILMRCITQEESHELLTEIHGGECGSHSSSRTLVGKAFRHGFYWPTALQDATELVKSCEACQFHAKQIHTPAQALQMIPPSWPFAVWGGGYPGAIPQGCRRVPFPLRRHRQVHKVAGGYPYGQYHPRCCCCFSQVDCLQIWGPKPYHYGQWDLVQKSSLLRVLRGHWHPALLCVCGSSQEQRPS
jgi:hypothetical protein